MRGQGHGYHRSFENGAHAFREESGVAAEARQRKLKFIRLAAASERVASFLTDHTDRNSSKNLLRGKLGYIYGWQADEEEEEEACVEEQGDIMLQLLPKVVHIKSPGRLASSRYEGKESLPNKIRTS